MCGKVDKDNEPITFNGQAWVKEVKEWAYKAKLGKNLFRERASGGSLGCKNG